MPIGGKKAKSPTMSSKKPPEQIEKEKREAETVKMVGQSVLEQLGKPPGFERVDARLVGEGRFRVNVWAKDEGMDFGCKVVDSFYVWAEPDGIVNSNPKIAKKY